MTKAELKLLTAILGLKDERVADAIVAPDENRLDLTLAAPEGPHMCPHCGREHTTVHDRRDRSVRDKPWADMEVYIHFTLVRVRCCKGQAPIEIEPSSWVKKNAARASVFAR